MQKIWQTVAKLLGGQESKQLEQADSMTSATVMLQRLKDAAKDVISVKGELLDRSEKGRFVQAQIYVAAASVLKVIADSLGSAVGISESSEGGLVRDACALYREALQVVEKARRELARPSARPQPFYMEGLISTDETSQEQLLLYQQITQKLEQDYQIDLALAGEQHDMLKDLLARLESKTNVVQSIVGDGFEISQDNCLWAAQIFDEIFSLWLLIAQELVCPGITESLKLVTEEMDPNDVWLMTDPVARARYEQEGMLEKLENDIRYEVMRGEPWRPEDLEVLKQIKLLEARKIVRKLASFWSLSPHPPIYRALKDGEIRLGGKRYPFKKDQEIVWACPMTRDMANLDAPVLIEDLRSQRVNQLCGDMSNAMMGRGMKPMG